MCKSALHDFLVALPKVEQHLHIEGTLEPSLLFQLAAKNNISLPDDPAYASEEALLARYAQWSCLDDFLGYYYAGTAVLTTAEDFETLAWSYLTKAASQRICHAEIFFDPQAHTVRGVSYDTVVSGLLAAKRRADIELPNLTVEYIVCILRHLPVAESQSLVNTVIGKGHLTDGTLRGLGMVSSEKAFPPSLFADIYSSVGAAMDTNQYLTAHAGEETGPEAIHQALDLLKVNRIDHGRAAGQDATLMKLLAEKQILLTLCPWSNVVLRNQESIEDAPIRAFLNAGVRFSINTDDPAYFGGIYLQELYCAVQKAFDLSVSDWKWIVEGSIDGSWCSEERKQVMRSELNGVLTEFSHS